MGYAQEVRAIVNGYLSEMDKVETQLGELEELASVFSKMIANNAEIHSQIHGYEQQIAYLYSQREELYNDYHNAMFEGDTARVMEIEGERDNIDEQVANLQHKIEDSRKRVTEPDGNAVTEMLDRLSAIRVLSVDNQWHVRRDYSQRNLRAGFLDQLRTLHEAKASEIGQRKLAIVRSAQWHRYTSTATVTA